MSSGVHLTGKPSHCCYGSDEWQGLQVFSGVHLKGKSIVTAVMAVMNGRD